MKIWSHEQSPFYKSQVMTCDESQKRTLNFKFNIKFLLIQKKCINKLTIDKRKKKVFRVKIFQNSIYENLI